jgi:hypothetical protein
MPARHVTGSGATPLPVFAANGRTATITAFCRLVFIICLMPPTAFLQP